MSTIVWAVSRTATLSSALQILLFLPLTLATLSTPAFLLLSFLLSLHALIHGSLVLFLRRPNLFAVLQVPMHPFLLLVCFNAFSSSSFNVAWLVSAAKTWGELLKWSGPLFIGLEGLSSLLVAQKCGQEGKKLVEKGEHWQFGLLIATAASYVVSAWWIISSYGAAASSPLSSTLLGVALTAFVFLSFIGFVLRRTNIIESSVLSLFIAYNVWLCGFSDRSFSEPGSAYVYPLTHFLPLFETLINFVTNTLPKPVLIALLFRLTVLHLASRILPTIGADVWDSEDGVDGGWNERPTSNLTRILLTYRQFIFVSVYSHLLLLDHSSSIWWRWMNIFSTLALWSVELLVSPEDDAIGGKEWKID